MTLDILSASGTTILHFSKLLSLAKDAERSRRIIENYYSVGDHAEFLTQYVGLFNGIIYNVTFNITQNQVLFTTDNGREWTLKCTTDDIYACYRAEYLVSNKLDVPIRAAEALLVDLAPIFRDWVERQNRIYPLPEEKSLEDLFPAHCHATLGNEKSQSPGPIIVDLVNDFVNDIQGE